ncbi:hypothetical protein M436DRAFT_64072 [Aureobasidium namibiae CBS 147.97]|uniref:Uncharacterized protein n=1 Tax=Aureobasidium namibiae CBS 147.97 TaxID=1043004 RepID=A0A074WMT3_9PEZI
MRTELIIQGIRDQLPSAKYRRHAVRRLIRDIDQAHDQEEGSQDHRGTHPAQKKPSSKRKRKRRSMQSSSPPSSDDEHHRFRERKPSSKGKPRDAQKPEERSPILTVSTGGHVVPQTQPDSVLHLMGEAENYCLPVDDEQSFTQQNPTYDKPKKPPVRYDASTDADFSLDRPYSQPPICGKPSTDKASLSLIIILPASSWTAPTLLRTKVFTQPATPTSIISSHGHKSSSKQKRYHGTYSASSIS